MTDVIVFIFVEISRKRSPSRAPINNFFISKASLDHNASGSDRKALPYTLVIVSWFVSNPWPLEP